MLLNKHICDLCGKDCEEGDYVVPAIELETVEAKNAEGVTVTQFTHEKLIKRRVDMCDDCRFKVAHLLDLVKNIDLSKHDICLIDKEDS